MGNPNDRPRAVRIDQWGNVVEPARGRRVPLLGVFLILLGILLIAGQFLNVAAIGASAFFLALGVVLLAAGLRDRNDLALYVGLFVTAVAASDLLSDVGVIHGSGWGMLLFGVALIGLGLTRMRGARRLTATLAIGVLLAVWGGASVAAANLNFSVDRVVGPALVILLGAWLVMRSGAIRR